MTASKLGTRVHESCLICGGTELTPLAGFEAAHLVGCNRCGFVFAQRRPTDDELSTHYAHYGTAWQDSPITRQRYRELLQSFEPYRSLNRLLDVGCGAGYFLEEATAMGWNAVGTEFGLRALEMGREKGLRVLPAPLTPETFSPSNFDVVTAFEVLEHLRDPGAEMRLIACVTRPGGLFYCTTPNFSSLSRRLLGSRWSVIGYPEHLGYFTRRTLGTLAQETGFSVTEIKTTGIGLSALRGHFLSSSAGGVAGPSGDERVREAAEGSTMLGLAKRAVNGTLSLTGLGDTLKGRFERMA